MSLPKLLAALLLLSPMMHAAGVGVVPGKGVAVSVDEAKHRVDISFDGKPFTSYLWETNQRKPVLYPLIAPDGTTVTRGYPFETRSGERVDHPHHAGLWFNYGNANGFDFWNNSDAVKAADRPKYGSIRHDRIVSSKSGAASGELVTESTWIAGDSGAGNTQSILKQTMHYVFSSGLVAGQQARIIDLTVNLSALVPVVFHDDKEGLLGIRVAHFLESPTEKGGTFMDANGNPTTVAAADTAGATGIYRTSEGKVGDAVWSTRGSWCELAGTTADNKAETIAIFDHTGNPGYPAYWHARGYGLFAVNPLGAHIFDPKTPVMDYKIDKGSSATFRYRIVVLSGKATPAQWDAMAKTFDGTP